MTGFGNGCGQPLPMHFVVRLGPESDLLEACKLHPLLPIERSEEPVRHRWCFVQSRVATRGTSTDRRNDRLSRGFRAVPSLISSSRLPFGLMLSAIAHCLSHLRMKVDHEKPVPSPTRMMTPRICAQV
jgi:hypothetical protein